MIKKILLTSLLVAGALLPTLTLAKINFVEQLQPTGFVNDYANILKPETKALLENNLAALKASTTVEFSVVTIPSLNDYDIESVANELFRHFGLGDKTKNNGLLLLIASTERKLRFEVGYGLEGALPDLLTKQISDTYITPEFKAGNYDAGIVKGVEAATEVINGNGDEVRAEVGKSGFRFNFNSDTIFFLLFVGYVVISIVGRALGKTKSFWLGGAIFGVVGLVVAFILISSFVGIVFLTIVGIILGTLLDFLYSNGMIGKDSGGPGGFFGPGFGGGSGGGGFGGFGGGSSGGGGSSSSW
jgi:uncharacterized protein